jgi:uncharacterized membrane protein
VLKFAGFFDAHCESMPGAALPPLPAESEFCLVSRRNDSLGSRWRWRVFASLCGVSLGFAFVFAAFGAWLVLPYSALEMALLYAAFLWIERHASDWERVSVCGDRVIVERECGGVQTRCEFNRYWTRVEVKEEGFRRAPALWLRFKGQSVAFGAELAAADRVAVARDLRHVLAKT